MVKPSVSQERARELLRDDSRLVGRLRRYFDAVITENLPRFYLDLFLDYRNNYSDDLPELNVSYSDPNYFERKLMASSAHPSYPKLKCRGNCIIGMSLELNKAVEEEVIDTPEIVTLVEKFRNYNWSFGNRGLGGGRTTREEIDFINKTLDKVIQDIRRKYSF